MELVSNYLQILENLRTLDAYKNSNDLREARYYRNRIRDGICFVIHEEQGVELWGPSRFVGYQRNTLDLHANNHAKDGKETTPKISEIFASQPELHQGLEGRYREYCRRLGFVPRPSGPFGKPRRYWLPHPQ